MNLLFQVRFGSFQVWVSSSLTPSCNTMLEWHSWTGYEAGAIELRLRYLSSMWSTSEGNLVILSTIGSEQYHNVGPLHWISQEEHHFGEFSLISVVELNAKADVLYGLLSRLSVIIWWNFRWDCFGEIFSLVISFHLIRETSRIHSLKMLMNCFFQRCREIFLCSAYKINCENSSNCTL